MQNPSPSLRVSHAHPLAALLAVPFGMAAVCRPGVGCIAAGGGLGLSSVGSPFSPFTPGLGNAFSSVGAGLGALTYWPWSGGYCSNGGYYVNGVCAPPFAEVGAGYGLLSYGQCTGNSVLFAGACAPALGIAYSPFLLAALATSNQAVRPLRLAGAVVSGRLWEAQQAAMERTTPPSADRISEVDARDSGTARLRSSVDAAMQAFFTARACPLFADASPVRGGLSASLAATAPRCSTATSREDLCACLADAELSLAAAAVQAVQLNQSLARALSDAAVQAACGKAAVEHLLALGVPRANMVRGWHAMRARNAWQSLTSLPSGWFFVGWGRTQDAAGAQCGDHAARTCSLREAHVAPMVDGGCRAALTEGARRGSMGAYQEQYCDACFWSLIGVALNQTALPDETWCAARRAAAKAGGGDGDEARGLLGALLGQQAFLGSLLCAQASARRLLQRDVLVEAPMNPQRCWASEGAAGASAKGRSQRLLTPELQRRVSALQCARA